MGILTYWRSGVFAALAVCGTAAEHHGQVKFGTLPVPGAVVTATRAERTLVAVTNPRGVYSFPDLSDGQWMISVQMTGFATETREISISNATPAAEWELRMLRAEEIHASTQIAPVANSPAEPTPPEPKAEPRSAPVSETFANASAEELAQRADDGLLINGSAINAASSPFSQSAAFGNNRRTGNSLYNGNLGFIMGNDAFDARPFSLTGQDTPKPDYNRITGVASFGGPLKIPHILRNGPNVTINYQWTRNRNAGTQSALMPTQAMREGNLPQPIIDPVTGHPFPNNKIPANRISPQATALLGLYPLPNFENTARYNYQIPVVSVTHQDNLQSRFNQRLTRANQLYGNFAYMSTRTDSPSIFGFLDKTNNSGINTAANWLHTFNPRLYAIAGMQYSRFSMQTMPFFANRRNISAEAGIQGNNQDPENWGPPALSFSSGIASLTDAQYSVSRNQTVGVSLLVGWNRRNHNFTFGGGGRRQQFNVISQEEPRGSFAFTGAAAGSDFGGFLLGIPDTSSIAYGNADKYFRGSLAEGYFSDDWRVRAGLTLNFGIRWEYGSPVVEKYGRLVNLDIAPDFSTAVPVTGDGLLHPDRNNFAPRFGFAWRPLPASSLVIRGGYGIYYDTSIYQRMARQMSQQSPLSTSLRLENNEENPLTLASGFPVSSATGRNTFAVDPDYRTGYSQNWQLSIQRDLPASIVLIATYSGIKGTRAQQQLLPNTAPIGVDICALCPIGFSYLTSNGNSTRHAAQLELRRRLRAGFTASLQYTFSKSIDNAATLGGPANSSAMQSNSPQNSSGIGAPLPSGSASIQSSTSTAQNWRNLQAERGRSNFDQRHLLNATIQYTSGIGLRGGTLVSGWRGTLLKEWTFATQITAGTGLPLTPVYFAAVPGTGVTGTIRPDYTGAPLYDAPSGFFLNPAAYRAPAAGQWGNSGRNSITGPSQFSLNASMGRTFRIGDRLNFDVRVDATNALNHPVFPSWNTTVNSAQFGLPNPANPMRSLQTTARLRF